MYVEYSSNNSGGYWWLNDEDWHALEAAGWKVRWVTLEVDYDAGLDSDGTPKLRPRSKDRFALDSDGRWLGALAWEAYKPGATSLREAAEEWSRITNQSPLDAGCPCCGNPHRFTLYDDDGKYVESGPEN